MTHPPCWSCDDGGVTDRTPYSPDVEEWAGSVDAEERQRILDHFDGPIGRSIAFLDAVATGDVSAALACWDSGTSAKVLAWVRDVCAGRQRWELADAHRQGRLGAARRTRLLPPFYEVVKFLELSNPDVDRFHTPTEVIALEVVLGPTAEGWKIIDIA